MSEIGSRFAAKATSVTAICVLLLVVALIALTFCDAPTWKETFAGTLGAFVGYYIGRVRQPPATPPAIVGG